MEGEKEDSTNETSVATDLGRMVEEEGGEVKIGKLGRTCLSSRTMSTLCLGLLERGRRDQQKQTIPRVISICNLYVQHSI